MKGVDLSPVQDSNIRIFHPKSLLLSIVSQPALYWSLTIPCRLLSVSSGRRFGCASVLLQALAFAMFPRGTTLWALSVRVNPPKLCVS